MHASRRVFLGTAIAGTIPFALEDVAIGRTRAVVGRRRTGEGARLKTFIVILATLLFTAPQAAQQLPELTAHDAALLGLTQHDPRPGHVDTYTGFVTVRAQPITPSQPGIVVLVDEQQFLIHTDTQRAFTRWSGVGVVEFWHDGLRVTVPDARRVLQARVEETTVPTLSAPRYRVTRVRAGGLVQRMGPLPGDPVVEVFGRLQGLDAESCDYCPFYQDPGDGGGGGGGGTSCDPRGCSVSCSSGTSCSASCGSGYKASCWCGSFGGAQCVCSSCR